MKVFLKPSLKKVLFIICTLLLFTIIGCNNAEIKFNHDAWIKAKDTASWDIRKKMAKDIMNRQLLINKSEKEVNDILGTPEAYADVETNKLYYIIEMNYGYDIDPVKIVHLIVSLDSKGKVIKVSEETIEDN